MRLLAATGDGIAIVEDGRVETVLQGSARCVAAGDGLALAGGADGAAESRDDGRTWADAGLPARDVYSVAVAVDGTAYAGCEPSALWRRRPGGVWEELPALRALPSAPTWSFPPRPWTSHVRWIAPSPGDPDLLLVGIELGGLMRSEDAGETWVDHRPGAQRDVHTLAWHPSARGRAYEAGGGGAAWSRDGGDTWSAADAGRDRHYTWAVVPDPADPDRWYCSASPGPFAAHRLGRAQARLYRWEGDGPWAGIGDELDAMPYALAFADGELVAGLADGRLLAVDSWRPVAEVAPRILALA